MKKLLVLLLLLSGVSFAQDTVESHEQEISPPSRPDRSIYQIGTGVSLTYFSGTVGFNVDSLHLFHDPARPFDKALLKVGMGMDYQFDNSEYVGFNFGASLGYLYIQNQYHPKSVLSQFGAGVTFDFGLINTRGYNLGATLYLVLNKFLVGVSGGGVLLDDGYKGPYLSLSFALLY